MPNDELIHFGVLGMRWGHRRYITRDGKLTTKGIAKLGGSSIEKDLINSKDRLIKKGTIVQNISNAKLPANLNNGLYTSYTKFDNDHYVDLMGSLIYRGKSYRNRFIVSKDIRIPSDRKAVEIFLKTLKENPDAVLKDMTRAYNQSVVVSPILESTMKKTLRSLGDEKSKKSQLAAKEFLSRTIMDRGSTVSRNLFFGNVLKEGYDAISDPNDRDSWAQDPLLIVNVNSINRQSSLKLSAKDLEYYSRYKSSQEHQSRRGNLTEVQR